MIKIFISTLLFPIFISGCFSSQEKTENTRRVQLGDININYYSDKSVTSLEIPPDLSSPSYENSFRMSELVSDYDEKMVNLTGKEIEQSKEKILEPIADIVVKKFRDRRWLIVDKKPEIIWNISMQFLKNHGFAIKNTNKKIGIIETDFRENKKPEIPSSSIGNFRAYLSEVVENVNYTLPSVDKYKIRIEPTESGKKSEVHLSIQTMAEVSTGDDQTMWQVSEKNSALENEMLYSLMLFMGSDAASAREKIINAADEKKFYVSIQDGISGYAKLVFDLNLIETWDNMSWALSELNVSIEDKDLKEKTFYINTARTADKGIMSRLFGEDAINKTFQIQLKQIKENVTEVYFNDISEINAIETKEFSYDLLKRIRKLF